MTGKPASGFTLLELLTSATILITILAISSGMINMLEAWRFNSATSLLFENLQAARSIALQRQRHTILCAEADQNCTSNWSQGVMILIDENNNRKADSYDTVVYTTRFESGIKVKWKAFQNKSLLVFTPEGFTDNQNGRFHICTPNSSNQRYRQVIVNKAGRARQVYSAPLGDTPTCQ